jgi:hypothetical protein
MKVSQTPSPIQTVSAMNVNQNNQLLMPMNRSQSVYIQSPKLNVNTHHSGQQMKKISMTLRSPSSDHSNQFEIGEAAYSMNNHQQMHTPKSLVDEFNRDNEKKLSEVGNHASLKRFYKFSSQNENIFFVVNSKYGNWFSWCQSCKHGGHIKHLIDWFRSHQKCPFLHCKCCCISIDYSY